MIIKIQGGFSFVRSQNKIFKCSVRGRLKKGAECLLVGDRVVLTVLDATTGVIEDVLPRRNVVMRPAVANVDQVIVTFAAVSPLFSATLLDHFLVLAAEAGLPSVVCINKIDLVDAEECAAALACYRQIGYEVLLVSARTGAGIPMLRQLMLDKISVFAGPSGVGKSSLVNAVQPGLLLHTGEVSMKIGRGRHTTRHVELLPLEMGGYVVDTPGFSRVDITHIPARQLGFLFPEIAAQAGHCKFVGCLHWQEPQCAVKRAVASQQIPAARYQSYLAMLQEIKDSAKEY